MAAARLSQLQKRILCWVAADDRRTKGVIASSHRELVCALQSDKGNISHRLRPLEARNLLVIGRSSGGKAEYLRRTPEAQKWAVQLAGSCD
jgi:DNA-binding MarR family transcriptional regulator